MAQVDGKLRFYENPRIGTQTVRYGNQFDIFRTKQENAARDR
jgi:hypothetical protein